MQSTHSTQTLNYICQKLQTLNKMKKGKIIILLAFTITCLTGFQLKSNSQDTAIKEIVIGKQTWMQTNLNTVTFKNGDLISEAKNSEDWLKAATEKQPAWCYFGNNQKNGLKYGRLYNWYAVNDARGIAPAGWHVPTDVEWTELIDYLGGAVVALNKMKSSSNWKRKGNGNNASGFSGLPSGYRGVNGKFYAKKWYTAYWSSSENNPKEAWIRSLFFRGSVERHGVDKVHGFSIRCVKD